MQFNLGYLVKYVRYYLVEQERYARAFDNHWDPIYYYRLKGICNFTGMDLYKVIRVCKSIIRRENDGEEINYNNITDKQKMQFYNLVKEN